jgi:hypothetical protein
MMTLYVLYVTIKDGGLSPRGAFNALKLNRSCTTKIHFSEVIVLHRLQPGGLCGGIEWDKGVSLQYQNQCCRIELSNGHALPESLSH